MEDAGARNLKLAPWTVLLALLRPLGGITRRVFIALSGIAACRGFAESGARNWLHSAATVLAFLQKEREILRSGYTFRPISGDGVSDPLTSTKPHQSPPALTTAATHETFLALEKLPSQ